MSVALRYDHAEVPMFLSGIKPARPSEFVVRTGVLTFDASYPNTGGTVGEPLTATMLQLSEVLWVKFAAFSGQVFQYDYVNAVVHAYRSDIDNVADAPLVEFPNATDLSAVAPHFMVIGRKTHDSVLP